jgi:outer membrane protein OmpA-like peptidoglycan-associated protein
MKRMMCRVALLGLVAVSGCKAEAKVNTPPPPPATVPTPAPAVPLPDYITVRERIEFETDSAVLLATSLPILDEVIQVMKDNPQITLVEIGGHTDTTGDADANLLLSEQRAQSVKAYFISKGIAEQRMRVRGFGQTVPVASNDTPDGRLQNRRVEFRIVKQPQ